MQKTFDEETKASIGLSYFEGIGPVRYQFLVSKFGSAGAVYHASITQLKEAGLSEKFAAQFDEFRRQTDLSKIATDITGKNIHIILKDDALYPDRLSQCPDAPFILYALGDRTLLQNDLPIAIVGTRKPTTYGSKVTRMIAGELANAGCTVVSGMAMGVDAIAHKCALDAQGKTIAVLGCGVDICYPAVNRELYNQLIKSGLIISEFPPGMTSSKGVFPARNRIIAGLSLGVLVTEGAEKSGSLITAARAAEYGRDVYSQG